MKKTFTFFTLIIIIISCNLKPFKAVSKVTIECKNKSEIEYDTNEINTILHSKLGFRNVDYKVNHIEKGNINIYFSEKIDVKILKEYIERNKKIEFWDTYNNTDIGNSIYEIANELLSKTMFPGYLDSIENINQNKEKFEESTYLTDEEVDSISEIPEKDKQMEMFRKASPLSAYLYPNADAQSQWVEGPTLGYAKLIDTAIINEYLSKKYLIDSIPYRDLKFMWESNSSFSTTDGIPLLNLYLVKKTRSGEPELDGKDVETAKHDFDPISRKPMVSIKFSNVGAIIWGDMTERSSRNYTGIAITLDNKVFSSPIASTRIEGGTTQITGGSFAGVNGVYEAQKVAAILNTGKSTYQFKIIGIQNVAKDE